MIKLRFYCEHMNDIIFVINKYECSDSLKKILLLSPLPFIIFYDSNKENNKLTYCDISLDDSDSHCKRNCSLQNVCSSYHYINFREEKFKKILKIKE